MAIHRQNLRGRTALAHRGAGLEQHLLSAAVITLALLAVLATLAA